MARIWKLEPSESVYEVEKYYEIETRDSLPLHIDGRVLKNDELLEDLNLLETEILLYEVQSAFYLKNNDKYAFIPKEKKEKELKLKQFRKNSSDQELSEEQLMKLPLKTCLESNSR